MIAAADVRRHTTGPEMLFPVTTASTTAGVTIEPVNEAVVNGADVSNLALELTAAARRSPDHPATITDTTTMTYADLREAASPLATLSPRTPPSEEV